MKVGNIEVRREASNVKLKLTTGQNWWVEFDRSVCNNYHAELEVQDIYKGLLEHRRELQRDILRALRHRRLPGIRRGRLAEALCDVESLYGL